MRNRRSIPNCATVAIAALIPIALVAQGLAVPVPEYDQVFYHYDRSTGKLGQLERQEGIAEARAKALGFNGTRVILCLNGARSPVRFHEGDKPEFIISFPTRTLPPTLQFYSVRVTKNRRELPLSET